MEDTFTRNYVQAVLKDRTSSWRIAFLGGSLTKGEFVGEKECFVSIFKQQIKRIAGHEVIVLPYGQSGTISANALYRLPELISEKPDIVFVDYAMNDSGERYLWESTEGIAYQLLKRGIGVVFLLFCNDRGSCTRGAIERVGKHYQIPVFDIGRDIYSSVRAGDFPWEKYAQDYVHPTAWGHALIAEQIGNLFMPKAGEPVFELAELPAEACFEGAFRESRIWEMDEELQDAQAGEIVFDGKIEAKMLLVETWQNCIPNEASILFFLDGEMVHCAEAYASMAWGNPRCRYLGGDGTLETHHLTVTLGKGVPPKGWSYSEFRMRFLIGL